MTLATFLVVFALIVAGGLVGLLMVATWCISEARDLADAYRGVATEVTCPRTDQSARVRVGRRLGKPGLQVLWCERFPEGTPRCGTECFAAFTGGPAPS